MRWGAGAKRPSRASLRLQLGAGFDSCLRTFNQFSALRRR